MLRSPLQRLQNEHVECSLQQLNPVFILVFLVHRCRHSTPKGGRSSTSFCIAQGGQNLAAERKERYPYAARHIEYCKSEKIPAHMRKRRAIRTGYLLPPRRSCAA